jgi:uncharacterized phiE125 gp8 family phage protein
MAEPRYKLKTAPVFAPVSLEEFKRNLHIGTQDEPDTSQDELLQEILDKTIEDVQTEIGRQLARATYTAYLDEFPSSDMLYLTLGPVAAISSVKYYNGANELITMSASDYSLDNVELTARLLFINTYTTYSNRLNAVEIEFTCGWANVSEIPMDFQDAIILLASERYLNPENMQLNFGMGNRYTAAERILRRYRVQRF